MAKRGQGEGTISQRPDGLWCGRITLGKDENGKQKRKAFYGKTRKEVQQKLTAALNEVNRGAYIEPSVMTVGQWMDIWLREYKYNSVKPGTYLDYCSTNTCHIKPMIGHIRLKDLRNDMVQRFVNDLLAKGLGPKTVSDCIVPVLKSALKEAVSNDLIAKSPATGVKLPRVEKADRRVLTQEEQQRFIEAAKRYEHGNAFILMLGTGLRIGETMALTWDDISLEAAELTVTKTQVEFTVQPDGTYQKCISHGTPKTKAGYRTIPLLPQLVEMLREIQRKQRGYMSEKGGAYTDNNLVFCTRFGKPLSKQTLNSGIKRVNGIAQLDGVHPHTLRHTFATRGMESGIPLKVMQELLGHSDISMTANLYTHVLPNTKQREIAKLSGTLSLGV